MQTALLDKFREYYGHFDQYDLNMLGDFYSPDIYFCDPVHEIHGLPELTDYFYQVCAGLIACRFEFVGETLAEESAWFKWVMHYQHPQLNQGESLELTGASYLRFNKDRSLIGAHEDFYDMGSMLYEHVPVLGGGVRWLKKRLVNE